MASQVASPKGTRAVGEARVARMGTVAIISQWAEGLAASTGKVVRGSHGIKVSPASAPSMTTLERGFMDETDARPQSWRVWRGWPTGCASAA